MRLPREGGGGPATMSLLPNLGRSIAAEESAVRAGCGRPWPASPAPGGDGGRTVTLSPTGPGRRSSHASPRPSPTIPRRPTARPGDPAPFALWRPLPGRAPERAALLTGARAGSCQGRLAAAGLLARAALVPPSLLRSLKLLPPGRR